MVVEVEGVILVDEVIEDEELVEELEAVAEGEEDDQISGSKTDKFHREERYAYA